MNILVQRNIVGLSYSIFSLLLDVACASLGNCALSSVLQGIGSQFLPQ